MSRKPKHEEPHDVNLEIPGFTFRETFSLVNPETCWGRLSDAPLTRTENLFTTEELDNVR